MCVSCDIIKPSLIYFRIYMAMSPRKMMATGVKSAFGKKSTVPIKVAKKMVKAAPVMKMAKKAAGRSR